MICRSSVQQCPESAWTVGLSHALCKTCFDGSIRDVQSKLRSILGARNLLMELPFEKPTDVRHGRGLDYCICKLSLALRNQDMRIMAAMNKR